jgi:hypothetical protein
MSVDFMREANVLVGVFDKDSPGRFFPDELGTVRVLKTGGVLSRSALAESRGGVEATGGIPGVCDSFSLMVLVVVSLRR